MTLLLKLSPRILVSLPRPDSTSSRMAGVISNCLPKYSTFIELPPRPGLIRCPLPAVALFTTTTHRFTSDFYRLDAAESESKRRVQQLVLHSALVGARDAHILPVLRDRAASDLDTLRLEDAGDLLVGQRPGGIFFLDELLDPAFEDQQRSAATLRAVHALAEEIAELEDSLRGMGVLIGNRSAHSRRMHANLFGDFLDHHRLQLVYTLVEEIALALQDRIAHAQNRLLALLDVFDELDGRLVALLNVIANIFFGGIAVQQTAIGRIEP